MKRMILTIFISLAMSLSVFAQADEKISVLIPYADYLKSVQNYYPGDCFSCASLQSPMIFPALSVIPLRLSNGKQVTAIIGRGSYKNLVYTDRDQQIQAEVFIFGRIISADKKIDGVFSDKLVLNNSPEELHHFVNNSIFYRKLLDLPIGNYELLFLDRNEGSFSKKIRKIKFRVS